MPRQLILVYAPAGAEGGPFRRAHSDIDATMGPAEANGSCEPTNASLSGAVELSGAVTVCCAP